MAKYGLPYLGSKQAICEELIKVFPKTDNFYDLFGGGFSVTDAMIQNRGSHYKQFHFNEIRPGICELIKDAIAGKYSYDVFKPDWISRERFMAEKDTNAYIKLCWSFGNNGKGYMFGKDIEAYKKSLHNAIVFNQFDTTAKEILTLDLFKEGFTVLDKRLFLRDRIVSHVKNGTSDIVNRELEKRKYAANYLTSDKCKRLQRLQRLEQLERLQQLEQLLQLEQLERLSFTNKSYEQIEIKDNSIIYCDPPYNNTAKYDGDFDTKTFLNWADNIQHPVYISEYNIDDKRFKKIFSIKKRILLGKPDKQSFENIYINKYGFKQLLLNR